MVRPIRVTICIQLSFLHSSVIWCASFRPFCDLHGSLVDVAVWMPRSCRALSGCQHPCGTSYTIHPCSVTPTPVVRGAHVTSHLCVTSLLLFWSQAPTLATILSSTSLRPVTPHDNIPALPVTLSPATTFLGMSVAHIAYTALVVPVVSVPRTKLWQ